MSERPRGAISPTVGVVLVVAVAVVLSAGVFTLVGGMAASPPESAILQDNDSPNPTPSGVTVIDDFEEDSLGDTGWSTDIEPDDAMGVSTEHAYHGDHSFRFHIDTAGDEGQTSTAERSFDVTSFDQLSVYVYVEQRSDDDVLFTVLNAENTTVYGVNVNAEGEQTVRLLSTSEQEVTNATAVVGGWTEIRFTNISSDGYDYRVVDANTSAVKASGTLTGEATNGTRLFVYAPDPDTDGTYYFDYITTHDD